MHINFIEKIFEVDYVASIMKRFGDTVCHIVKFFTLVITYEVTRILSGALSKVEFLKKESCETELIDCSQYNHLAEFRDWKVSVILLNCNHQLIEE